MGSSFAIYLERQRVQGLFVAPRCIAIGTSWFATKVSHFEGDCTLLYVVEWSWRVETINLASCLFIKYKILKRFLPVASRLMSLAPRAAGRHPFSPGWCYRPGLKVAHGPVLALTVPARGAATPLVTVLQKRKAS